MSEVAVRTIETVSPPTARPRLGFLGVGWIGRQRLEAIAGSGVAEIVAIAEPQPQMSAQASDIAPSATLTASLEELLESGPDMDGLVIATPSAMHAAQAVTALGCGIAVFCQKPLGRDEAETVRVVDAARQANKLLAVDLCYRFISGVSSIKKLIRSGELGDVYALDLIFHNAYGPDKPWFYDRKLSGGGCVNDLGIHLVDLAFWMLDFPRVKRVTSRLFAGGSPLQMNTTRVEDYATARLDFADGATAQLSCSWKLHAGCDARIEASFYGTSGGASLHNCRGSFTEFVVERFSGTSRKVISRPPNNHQQRKWADGAAIAWVNRLAAGRSNFNPQCYELIEVARTLDAIYENSDE